ncbi:hypothetical protein PVAP13_9NG247773 [Panicum virgatum]|uniref:Uncharacterized protein n=1 Tax=Panicum virgatum TaxID=38727 RepID=A0A8T0MLP2_PANVG|nr:hypothetical protein PVAP13_9NG247773 [Panicum virgatum]
MMPPSWNNFLRSLLRFVVVRSDHNEGLRRICRSVFFFFFGGRKKKTEDTRKKKFLHFACKSVGRHSLGFCSRVCLPGVCLCSLLYEATYRSEVENLDYTSLLDDQIVFQR